MREKLIEQRLVREVQGRGGICPKWVSPGFDGVPDRIVLMPHGHIAFVETKAPGKRLLPLQVKRKRQLESLGFQVYVLDNTLDIPALLDEIGGIV